MSIASNLRRAVDENGVSAASLAREIGAEPSTVREIPVRSGKAK